MFFDAKAEGELQYLESEEAYFTVMLKWGERVQSQSHPVIEMHERLERYSWLQQADVYQSQHWFSGESRMKVNLKGLGTSFFDGDYYKNPEHRGKKPEEVWEEMKALMVEKSYPLPSAVIASGQGVYVKWYFSKPLRREMLAYWDTLQIKFLNLFEGFGADPASRDASRILRVLGTYNQKNANRVRVLWLNEDVGKVRCYDFWELFQTFGCSEVLDSKKRIQRVKEMPSGEELQEIMMGASKDPERLQRRVISFANRGFHVVGDLKKLAMMREWDKNGIPDGQRDLWLFWMVNHVCLSYMTSHRPRNYHEALREVESFVPKHWSRRKFLNKMSAVYQKAKEMASGRQWVSFGGKLWPLYYTPSNKRLCEDLAISEEELIQLDYVRSDGTFAAQRTRKRREDGSLSREDYLFKAEQRREHARQLKATGMTWEEVGKVLSISRQAAQQLVNRGRN